MKDFRTVTLADQVFERLESDIIQGVYPRGEVLTELRLVEQLNVSRTPIREALRRLEQEHLIADTGKGTVVLGITAEDLVDIMDIRCKIEGLASYYAAKNASPDGLARLQHILDLQEFYFEKRDAEHLREMDDQFHDIICDMSGHAVISDTLVPLHRKTPAGWLTVRGARANNLKNIDVNIPLGVMAVVTGVSGSGKSSLVNEIIYKTLQRDLNRAHTRPGACDGIDGLEQLDKVIAIDQSPIGRTPRSNPATYTGLFDMIRKVFAATPEAKARGYLSLIHI